MRPFAVPSLVAVLAASLLLASAQAKDSSGLKAEVYPNFKIEFTRNGKEVKTLKAGTYSINVEDKSKIHDFHLVGPGVNKATGVPFVGQSTWRVTLKPGRYTFMCDPHASSMRGTFFVTK
jgi:plastocyanin